MKGSKLSKLLQTSPQINPQLDLQMDTPLNHPNPKPSKLNKPSYIDIPLIPNCPTPFKVPRHI